MVIDNKDSHKQAFPGMGQEGMIPAGCSLTRLRTSYLTLRRFLTLFFRMPVQEGNYYLMRYGVAGRSKVSGGASNLNSSAPALNASLMLRLEYSGTETTIVVRPDDKLSLKPIHSSRSSCIGSIDSARCAGIQVASNPSNAIARTTLANTTGSRGVA
jgi:hypothetical protein